MSGFTYPSSVGAAVSVEVTHVLSQVGVEVDLSQLAAVLENVRDGILTPPEYALKAAAEELVSAVIEEFQTAGRGHWEKLADSTIARRGADAQILVDNSHFRGSIKADVDVGASEAAATTDVAYAVYHVSAEPREIIPLRNPFDVPPEVLDSAVGILVEAIIADALAAA